MERVKSGYSVGGYLLEELVGSGGFATVYRARNTGSGSFGNIIAVKVLHPRRMAGKAMGRFREEGRLLAGLRHENVVEVYDFVETAGHLCILMEFMDTDLKKLLRSRTLSIDEALGVVIRAGRGLEYVHGRNIIHKDFTPSNILVSFDLKLVKVTDFGVAGRVGFLGCGFLVDGSLARSGTEGYTAPEQHRGRFDARTDVYAFGRTLERVFGTLGVKAPPEVTYVVERSVQRDPEERFQTVGEILYFLERAVQVRREESLSSRSFQEPSMPEEFQFNGAESFLSLQANVFTRGLTGRPIRAVVLGLTRKSAWMRTREPLKSGMPYSLEVNLSGRMFSTAFRTEKGEPGEAGHLYHVTFEDTSALDASTLERYLSYMRDTA